MSSAKEVHKALEAVVNAEKAAFFPRFFKSGPGEYGERDKFLGITVPNQRAISKQFYKELSIEQTIELLHSEWHEERLTALFILVLKFQKGNIEAQQEIVDLYLTNTKYVNNWDLVDSSAPYILGTWLLDKDRTILYKLAKSEHLWERRIAMVATLMFIRNSDLGDTLLLSEQLLGDKHDLMHKAVGWCLREVGKKDVVALTDFLDKYAATMPRTALRYSIEHLPESTRQHYLRRV